MQITLKSLLPPYDLEESSLVLLKVINLANKNLNVDLNMKFGWWIKMYFLVDNLKFDIKIFIILLGHTNIKKLFIAHSTTLTDEFPEYSKGHL